MICTFCNWVEDKCPRCGHCFCLYRNGFCRSTDPATAVSGFCGCTTSPVRRSETGQPSEQHVPDPLVMTLYKMPVLYRAFILTDLAKLLTDSGEIAVVSACMALTAMRERLTAEEIDRWVSGAATMTMFAKAARRALSAEMIAKPLEDIKLLERSREVADHLDMVAGLAIRLDMVAGLAIRQVMTSLTDGADLKEHPAFKKFSKAGAVGLVPYSSTHPDSYQLKEEMVTRVLVYTFVKVLEKLANLMP
jgi:hypothetical protein